MTPFNILLLISCLIATASTLCGQVLVNQSGYNTADSKRFTAPLAADATPFSIVTEPGGAVVFNGTVNGGVGDFTSFQPADTGNFRVLLGTDPTQETSYAFGIGPSWIERVSYRRMIQFFIDSRCGFGDATTWNVAGGKNSSGIAWRDSHQFSFELRTLIQWYAANPDAFGPDRMPIEGTYKGLRATLPADTPEIVRLIHWGVDIYLRGKLNHTLIKEELAYFLYYYPLFQQWIPISLYNEARDYLFPLWANTARDRYGWYDVTHTGNLFQTYTVMGGTKGSLPPGHSIIPNLLMHAVALREGRSDAASYLTAARNQVQWIVNNLDPANPLVTKGQRMSEQILVPALAEFMMRDPSGPVTGVDAWLANWTDVVIARSNNYWDFRKYSDTIWTPENVPGSHPWWNEPGNIAGFPASALAAVTRLSDPVKIARLRAIAISQLDQVFGRNPHNRHFSFRATQPGYGFEGVETGWFSQHLGGLGILENSRGVLDSSAKQLSFPYNPNVAPGYVEGWVAFNSAWNASMIWAARDRSSIRFLSPDPQGAVGSDGVVQIELTAPLNFNRNLAEPAVVRVTSVNGDTETLTLTETGADTAIFKGLLFLENTATSASGNGILQATVGTALTATYAYDVFTRNATATAADTTEAGLVITTNSLPVARAGTAYSPLTLTAINTSPPLTWQITVGSLPAGMELLAGGTLRGTPTEAGVFPLTVRAQDADSQTEKLFTLSCSALAITTSQLPAATSGQPYSQPLQTTGGLGAVTWTLSSDSSLPASFTLNPAGTISGTAFAAGQFTIGLTATDDAGLTVFKNYNLTIFGTSSGLRFTDTFDTGTGLWFKAAPASGDSLSAVNGQLEWKETGAQMSETIGRSFPAVTLAVGQKIRLSFDYRQNGNTTTNILRAGLYYFANPVTADNWAGANAIGAWKGYSTFVRDNSTTANSARVESGASTSGSVGPNNGDGDAEIGSKSTQFNLNDNGTVTYQVVFEVNRVTATRTDTLLTVSTTSASTTTHVSIPGSQTSGTIHSAFNTIVLRHAGGSGMPAYFDNLALEIIGGINPAYFTDWQDLSWPGVTDPAIIAAAADPDSDGLNNLAEWALHLDPKQSQPFVPAMVFDGDYILHTYNRRKTAAGASSFHVEWSETLATDDWSEIDVVPSPPVSIDATSESVTSSIPTGSGGRRFVRVRITNTQDP